MAKDKDEDEKKRPPRTGSVAPEDDELTLWLNQLWAEGELPERLEVWQMFGRNKAVRGEMIHHKDFTFGKKLDIEEVNRLANNIMAACQHDCDSQRREAWYQLAIIDPNRRSSPLTRRIGPLMPRRQYALGKQSELAAIDDEDDEDSSPATLQLKYIREGMEQVRWDKQRNDSVLGQVLMLLVNQLTETRGHNDRLMQMQTTSFMQLQDSLDRAEDRKTARERENFRQTLMRDGLRTARNLLPALFGNRGDDSDSGNGKPPLATETEGSSTPATKKPRFGNSQERTLVDNFLSDVEENEELNVKLFGDYEVRDGKLVCVKPGIFTVKQYGLFIAIREGHASPDDVDLLLPGSPDPRAITQAQIEQAMSAGVTDGIGSAIMELIGLRTQKKTERKQSAPKAE